MGSDQAEPIFEISVPLLHHNWLDRLQIQQTDKPTALIVAIFFVRIDLANRLIIFFGVPAYLQESPAS
jgi:hypothetical protein